MTVHPRFGVMVGPDTVGKALLGTLQSYLLAYVAEIERQDGLAPRTLPAPKSFQYAADLDERRPEHHTPSVWVLSPGLDNEPIRHAKGKHGATFDVMVGSFVTDQGTEKTRVLSSRYCRALRGCLLREAVRGLRDAGLGECGVTWTDETYNEGDTDQRRTIGVAVSAFTVQVETVAQAGPSPFPAGPPADPYAVPADLGTVVRADHTVLSPEESTLL